VSAVGGRDRIIDARASLPVRGPFRIPTGRSAVHFLGPTGVGKTELWRALANSMFDDEHADPIACRYRVGG